MVHERVHAHGMRDTHAAELAREELPMNLVPAQLLDTALKQLMEVALTIQFEPLGGSEVREASFEVRALAL
jgi:hypothetical protein